MDHMGQLVQRTIEWINVMTTDHQAREMKQVWFASGMMSNFAKELSLKTV
jgi:hypothetical protein